MCLLQHDRLLTNMNMNRIGLGSPMCHLCGDIEKDSLHVFLDFPLVMPVWMTEVHIEWTSNFFGGSLE